MARGQNAVAGFFSGCTGYWGELKFTKTWQKVAAGAVMGGASSELAGEGFERDLFNRKEYYWSQSKDWIWQTARSPQSCVESNTGD